jgi:hypothetical protein
MNYTFFKIGFELNLISKNDLISFSQKEIESNYNEFHFEILTLSNESNSLDFIEIFNLLGTEIKKDEFLQTNAIFINYIFKEKDWFQQQELLLKYYSFFNIYLDEDDFEFWSRLKDDFSLRKEGFSGCMKMPSEMKNYFKDEIAKITEGTFFANLLICLGK